MAGAPKERVHTFLVVEQPGKPKRVLVWDTQDVSVGRAPENDLSFDLPDLSRRHAVFTRLDDAYLVKDLGTSNGTRVKGQAVGVHKLSNQDAVDLAEIKITFYRLARNPATLGDKVEYASQLKSFGLPGAASASPESTILGLGEPIGVGDDDEFEVRPAGEFDFSSVEDGPRAPRNLDLELDAPDLDELELAPPGRAPALTLDDEPAGVDAAALHLELEGLSAELRRKLQALVGKGLKLPALRIRLK